MKHPLIFIICLLFPLSLFSQTALPPIPGWAMQENGGQYKFTPPEGNFEYDVMPVQKEQVDNFMEWIKALSAKDLPASGYSAPLSSPAPIAKYVQKAVTYSVMVNDKQNKRWGVMYFAYQFNGNEIRYGKVIWIPGSQGTALNTAFRHFATLMKQETGANTAKSADAETGTRTTATTRPKNSRLPSPTTAPGKGLSPPEISGVMLHSETGIGVGGMVLILWKPFVFLKNGTMYAYPDINPYDLDVPKSKQQEPEKWGTWKINGKIVTVTRGSKNGTPSKVEEWKSGWWAWASPAGANEKLNASFNSLSGGGNTAMGGSTMTVSSSNITFNNNGQFTYESTGGGSYSGSGANVTAYSSKNKAGTYKLDGFSIELKYNNGTTTRQCFYFFDNDKRVFGIGNRAYTPSDK